MSYDVLTNFQFISGAVSIFPGSDAYCKKVNMTIQSGNSHAWMWVVLVTGRPEYCVELWKILRSTKE